MTRRLLVDLDGVVADWCEGFDIELDRYGDAAQAIPRRHERTSWDLKEGRTQDERRIVNEIMRRPGFYARLRLLPGAREALEEMLEEFDVRIVTAPYISNPTCASDKLAWIEEHLGSKWPRLTVLAPDKTLVRGDFLFDDKPYITGVEFPSWRQVVVSQPYNMHIFTRPNERVSSLAHWKEALA